MKEVAWNIESSAYKSVHCETFNFVLTQVEGDFIPNYPSIQQYSKFDDNFSFSNRDNVFTL